MVALTFPDGARREYPRRHHRSRHRQGHFALARQAHGRDGARRRGRRPRRPDREGRQDRIPHPRRPARAGADPARRRACAGRSGAGAVARHAGHHRPGDRQRLLSTTSTATQPFTPEDLPVIEKKMREIIARDKPFTKEVWSRDEAKRVFTRQGRELQGRAGRRHPGRPGSEDLQAGRLVRSLPRPAHDLDRQDRQRLQAEKVAGAYWRGDSNNPMLTRIYGTAFAKQEELDAYLQAARGSREARPPQARPRDGPVPLPGGRPRHGVLARQRLDHLPGDRRLHAPAAARRLSRGERAAAARQVAVGDLRPLGLVPREHVHGARRPATRPRTSASSRSSR